MTSFPSDAIVEQGYSANDFKDTPKKMGLAIPGSATPGFSAIYKNGMYPGELTRYRSSSGDQFSARDV